MESARPGIARRSHFHVPYEGNMENVCMIGLDPAELRWLRLVISLLRHPDPVVGEVSREALRYLEDVAARTDQLRATG
jgi:hypothetical protein